MNEQTSIEQAAHAEIFSHCAEQLAHFVDELGAKLQGRFTRADIGKAMIAAGVGAITAQQGRDAAVQCLRAVADGVAAGPPQRN